MIEISDPEIILAAKGQTFTSEVVRTGRILNSGILIEFMPDDHALITADSGAIKTSLLCLRETRLPWEETAQTIEENGLSEILFEGNSFAKSIKDDDNDILFTLKNIFEDDYEESPPQKDFSVHAIRLGLYWIEDKQSGMAVIELKPRPDLPGLFYYYSFRVIEQQYITYL